MFKNLEENQNKYFVYIYNRFERMMIKTIPTESYLNLIFKTYFDYIDV